ncbi:lysosome membrane protein 2-like [Mizuhopecten yessoensis]|uniref:Platelet glycoprotein 4 n=1 Tax=Mizuhopecten yessoensis TaxID=6573 RepID=A0A210PT29_MIZYE|nr:lysosome membrane protein 2-like [Mizuhopecten yessoensis]OWF39622.1 Platelet glycoprotein 4 [Mizuhopecten yessoensis]
MGCTLNKKVLGSFCTGWILCILGAVMIPAVNWIIKQKVEQSVVLVEGGATYDIWKDTPIPIYMQFYMFDVRNPEEVLQGKKPFVVQKGPYTYREVRTKFNIIHNDNGTVSYRQNRTFHFVPSMSVGNENETFTTPNPVYWSLISSLKWMYPGMRDIIRLVTSFEKESVFMERSMYDIIWGYQDKMLTAAQVLDNKWFYTNTIGYFMNKNATNDGVYTIYTGETDIQFLGGIDRYNGSSHLDFWSTPYANMINGTDGTVGPPYRGKNQPSPVFSSDACRSAGGLYHGDVTSPQGIKLWRYIAPPSYLANATENPDNIGFCTPESKCLNTGMLNISTCQQVDFFHIPVSVSFPHFNLAAQEYQDSVEGLHPVEEEHQTTVDKEPYTGLVLQVAKKIQLNMYLQPIGEFEATKDITPVFVPLFWVNESAVVDDQNADLLRSMLFTPLLVVHVIEISLISLGCLVLVGTVIYGLCIQQSRRKELFGPRLKKCNVNCFQGSHDMDEMDKPLFTE